jgi:hypothetical protein
LVKTTVKAEELHLKIAEAIKAGSGDTPLTFAGLASLEDLVQHSHKMSKGISGRSLAGVLVPSQSYLSPQRKGETANMRVCVQSPRHFSDRRIKTPSPSGSLSSGSLWTIGDDSDDNETELQVGIFMHVLQLNPK